MKKGKKKGQGSNRVIPSDVVRYLALYLDSAEVASLSFACKRFNTILLAPLRDPDASRKHEKQEFSQALMRRFEKRIIVHIAGDIETIYVHHLLPSGIKHGISEVWQLVDAATLLPPNVKRLREGDKEFPRSWKILHENGFIRKEYKTFFGRRHGRKVNFFPYEFASRQLSRESLPVSRVSNWYLGQKEGDKIKYGSSKPHPIIYKCFYRNGVIEGSALKYQNNGKLEERAYYTKEGWCFEEEVFHDKVETPADHQQLNRRIRYNHLHQLHGVVERWSPEGVLLISETYKDNQLHGPSTKWYFDGKFEEGGKYVDGLKDGQFSRRNHAGELTSLYTMRLGKKN